MTSGATKEETVTFFEQNQHFGLNPANIVFFEQEQIYCLTSDGKVSKGQWLHGQADLKLEPKSLMNAQEKELLSEWLKSACIDVLTISNLIAERRLSASSQFICQCVG